jgi:PiT family inorganic phosphate transporter
MIILISILPSKFALDHSRNPAKLRYETTRMLVLLNEINCQELNLTQAAYFNEIEGNLSSINELLKEKKAFSQLSDSSSGSVRKNILIIAKRSNSLLNTSLPGTDEKWNKEYTRRIQKINTYTEYSPWWVIMMISIALGLGTMIGWKRIVVTLGEKIGKSRLTYAQGAAANLVAASTISASSFFGLPVSTTHVLSSGIAGAMVSGNGLKNLQGKTLASIGIAWLITIPVTMLFSGLLFLLFRLILS